MTNKSLIIRVDSNPEIASGHLMRCIALAEEAKLSGLEVTFFMSDDKSKDILDTYGFNLINLNSEWRNLQQELNIVSRLLRDYDNPIYLVDTYSIDRKYVESLNSIAPTIYLGSKTEYLGKLRMLINYSANINTKYYNDTYPGTKLLLGVEYAPLRKEFSNIKRKSDDGNLHVLLTTGNTDNGNYIDKILSAILPYTNETVVFDIVIGSMFTHTASLIEKFSSLSNIRLHTNVNRISELMKFSSLAISAAGTTIYELAASKVPAIVFSMVPEQVPSAEGMRRIGIIEYCGEIYNDEMCIDNIKRMFLKYIDAVDLRNALSEKAFSRIDGLGCKKIINEINKLY